MSEFLPACLGSVEGEKEALTPISCYYWVCHHWKNPVTWSQPLLIQRTPPLFISKIKTQANLPLGRPVPPVSLIAGQGEEVEALLRV